MNVLATQTSHDLITMGIPVIEKLVRTVGVYVGLVLLLRLAGKRDLAQLNSFDLVVLLLLSNVVQNAVIGNDNSLTGGLIGALTLVALNAVVVRIIARSRGLARVIEGTETVLVRDGIIAAHDVHKLGLRTEEVTTALRRQGANTADEVALAVLKPGGTIEVTLKADGENATKADIARIEGRLDTLLARLGPG